MIPIISDLPCTLSIFYIKTLNFQTAVVLKRKISNLFTYSTAKFQQIMHMTANVEFVQVYHFESNGLANATA